MAKGKRSISTGLGVVRLKVQSLRLAGFLLLLLFLAGPATADQVQFTLPFAPSEGWVKPQEAPFRAELCLNGSWQFQPVAMPREFKPGVGVPPELPAPDAAKWDPTPLKVPSPWNVNTWGCGRDVGAGTRRPYWPDSVYYPSYPAAWDQVQMGWLRRNFRVPAGWTGRRIILHFEAVAGDCEVRINGRKAGSHFDKYLPFELDITDLVNRDQINELLVGIRAQALFDKRSKRFPKMTASYPCGSETDKLVGLWQDVYLLALPETRIEDVFVKPLVSQDTLELEVTIRNDSIRPQKIVLEGEISPWKNLAATNVLSAPEPKWRLDKAVLRLTSRTVTVQPGSTAKITLQEPVRSRLNSWKPGSPHLYAAILSLKENSQPADRRFTRFGWREFSIHGKDLLLNGEKIQLYGDLLHPFGPLTMSRRHTWAWYRFIQDFGGNAVRPHAQIHPRHYLELADEMGIVVLDESALFGSSIRLNFEEPAAWQRFQDHCDGLVLRDRNHPSVLGWSFGNELFAIFNLNSVPEALARDWYQKLAVLGNRVKDLDPTRPWISCDGDEDLRGTLPVWSKHFGHGTPLDRLPAMNKPLMVGESGGTYYARPRQLAEFNGPAAFESYAKRNEALAIDVYDNIVRMARPHLAWYSASETAWFGTEHLSFGYRDFSRLPGLSDGVFFSRPHAESTPGMQPERLPPLVATLNPGWDPSLPLYQPLAMFRAQKAALAKQGPLPSPWDHKPSPAPTNSLAPTPLYSQATLVADPVGVLRRRLSKLGVPFEPGLLGSQPGFTIIDADALTAETLPQARTALNHLAADGGLALLLLGTGRANPDQLATLLPDAIRVTDRAATALVPNPQHPATRSFTLPDLYFAEEGEDRFIQRHGLEGPLVEKSTILLEASNTDWSLFNNAPEQAKCAAVILYEKLSKPAGAALMEHPLGKGKLLLCTLDYRLVSRNADRLWRTLLTNLRLKLGPMQDGAMPAFDENGALLHALSIGRFRAPDLSTALARDWIGGHQVPPVNGTKAGELTWKPVTSPSRDRFLFHQLAQTGPETEPFAVYFSYWIRSPRALDDLLAGGPDVPRLTTFCYVADYCRLFLNGQEVKPTRTEPADYRTRYDFQDLPLKKDWNHFIVKVASTELKGDRAGTLAVRITATQDAFLSQLDSAVELKATANTP